MCVYVPSAEEHESDHVVIISEEVCARLILCHKACVCATPSSRPSLQTEEAAACLPARVSSCPPGCRQSEVEKLPHRLQCVAVRAAERASQSPQHCPFIVAAPLPFMATSSLKKNKKNNSHTFITDIYVRLAASQDVCFMTFKTCIYPRFSSRLGWRPSSAEC